MNSDIRLSVGFWQHPKTFRLERQLGLKAIRSLQILWCWCAQNRPDGHLADLDASEIEFVADWRGKKGAFTEAIISTGWLEETQTGYILHEWAEYNPYQAKGLEREAARKEKAQKAANARWKKSDADKCSDECSNNAKTDASICSDDAASNAQAMPSPTYTYTKDIKDNINPPIPPLQGGMAVDDEKRKAHKNKSGNGKLALQAIMVDYTSNLELLRSLDKYREMRERIRKPLTCAGLLIGLKELDKLASDDSQKIAIVEQSVFKSWQGFFPLPEKGERASPGKRELSLAEKNRIIADEVVEKICRERAGNE